MMRLIDIVKKITLLLIISTTTMFAQKKSLSAGDELIKAKNHFYVGTVMVLGGIGISSLTTLANDADLAKGPVIFGSILSLVGSVVVLESFSHIGKAGKKLNESKSIAIGISPVGASIKFRF